MANFSERYQLAPEKEIQLTTVDSGLFNRIWNIFYGREYESGILAFGDRVGIAEKLLDSFGCTYEYPTNHFDHKKNIEKLRKFLMDAEWYSVYDFIERYIESVDDKTERKTLEKTVNLVLEQEKSGYRMIKGFLTPITNSAELESIKKSMSTKFVSVNTHFEKAMKLYSNRKNPDYENSIKESISAVEAVCCIITSMTGTQATLGTALKKLEENGVYIHKAMKNAFSSLYGYTSDENGIRHGGIDFANAPAEDAKYMMISCSAFVNYLIEKMAQSKSLTLTMEEE